MFQVFQVFLPVVFSKNKDIAEDGHNSLSGQSFIEFYTFLSQNSIFLTERGGALMDTGH
jgi:hypothetical protein